MSFQEDPNTIRWRLNLKSQVDQVYQMLSTDAGRASFWGESAIERDGCIHFVFPNRIRWEAEILKTNPPHHYEVRYFDNSADAFALEEDGQGGTDLILTDTGVPPEHRTEVMAGWVSVLMSL